jgi:8-amino-7-oxononanoate synthase
MLDFTSALYLGLRHGSRSLAPWRELTTGVPAALRAAPETAAVVRRLAALQGCESTTVAPSTLHALCDLLGQLGDERRPIHMDAGTYAIGRLGAEIAAGRGASVTVFPRHDAAALRRSLRRVPAPPVVLADGYAPGVGPAPVRDYVDSVRCCDGLLVLDDTQALGLLGAGGGGSLRHHRIDDTSVVLVCSLAKGFGAPLAALSGRETLVRGFEARSWTRMHCSPPSIAVLLAAAHALEVNERCGDTLRQRLAALVRRFRRGLARAQLRPSGGVFPVQVLGPSALADPLSVHRHLLRLGVRCVPARDPVTGSPHIAFLFTVGHTTDDVDRAVAAVVRAARAAPAHEVAA